MSAFNPCPCCGFLTVEKPGGWESCPVCAWEDDPAQAANVDSLGGANAVSLAAARENYRAFGASERRLLPDVRPPLPGEIPERGAGTSRMTGQGIADAPFKLFARFLIVATAITVVTACLLMSVAASVDEQDYALIVPVSLVMSFFGLLLGVPVAFLTALLGFPLWTLLHRRLSGIPPRIRFALLATLLACVAGGVLALVTGLDMDVYFGPWQDIAFFTAIGAVCGTFSAWRVYADWL